MTRPLPWEKVEDWGLLEWARPIIDVIFDDLADGLARTERAKIEELAGLLQA